MDICFNEERAEKVFRVLDECYRQKRGLYQEVVLPQNQRPLPSRNQFEIAHWFFFAAHFMRGGVVNDTQFDFLWHLFRDFPDFYNPTEIHANWPPAKIAEGALRVVASKINTNGRGVAGVLGFKMEEHLAHLHCNAGILRHYWGGNILNVFAGALNFEEAFARIDKKRNPKGFSGIRRKIFALLTIWLQEAKIIDFFPAPIPVDFHAMRIFLQTGLVKNGGILPINKNERYPFLEGIPGRRVTEAFVNSIAQWTQSFLAKLGIAHTTINPACWILGRELCAGHFQMRPVGGKYDAYINPAHLEKNFIFWPVRYKNPCAYCPIESFCEAVVPSKPYYKWGLLVKLRRVSYPGKNPFLPEVGDSILPPMAKSRKKVIDAAR